MNFEEELVLIDEECKIFQDSMFGRFINEENVDKSEENKEQEFYTDCGVVFEKSYNELFDFWQHEIIPKSFIQSASIVSPLLKHEIENQENPVNKLLLRALSPFVNILFTYFAKMNDEIDERFTVTFNFRPRMTILTLYAFTEEYLQCIIDKVFASVRYKENCLDSELIKFINDLSRSSIPEKIDIILKFIGYYQHLEKILGRKIFKVHHKRFNEFIELRHKMAHGKFNDDLMMETDLKDDQIIEYLLNTAKITENGETRKFNDEDRKKFRILVESFRPLINIYKYIYPVVCYLRIVDLCIYTWKLKSEE